MTNFILTYLDGLAPLLPLVLLVSRYNSIQLTGKQYVLGYYLISFAGYLTADFIGDQGGNNLLLYNLLPIIFLGDLFFFFTSILDNSFFRKFNPGMILLMIIAYALSFEFTLHPSSFRSLYYIIFSIFVLANALGFYYREFTQMNEIAIWRKVEFWFVSSLLFYASISVVIWGFFKILMDKATRLGISDLEMRYIGDLWKLHNVVFLISCLLFFFSLLWKRSKITY